MKPRLISTRLLTAAIAACLIVLFSTPTEAAVLHEVKKGSHSAHHFKVEANEVKGGVRVTVTAPKSIDRENISSLRLYSEGQTQISTNGTTLEFLIDAEKFGEAIVYVGYTDPNHNPEETGGFSSYGLNISSLSGK